MIKPLKAIQTHDADGHSNGFVLPIWNSAFDEYKPRQVYLTVVASGGVKGPHLHLERAGAFTCIKGLVLIVTRIPHPLDHRKHSGEYREHLCGEGHFKTVFVPPGTPAALYNIGPDDAYVLNMPTPPWRDNSDEHKVEDWDYRLDNPDSLPLAA